MFTNYITGAIQFKVPRLLGYELFFLQKNMEKLTLVIYF